MAWTICSDACLLDQITYTCLLSYYNYLHKLVYYPKHGTDLRSTWDFYQPYSYYIVHTYMANFENSVWIPYAASITGELIATRYTSFKTSLQADVTIYNVPKS